MENAKITAEIDILETHGLKPSNLICIDNASDSTVYSYKIYHDITSDISISYGINNDIYFTNVEGDKTDIVHILEDGRVFLNEKEVLLSVETDDRNIGGLPSASITPRYSMHWKTETCPYYSPSDYSDPAGSSSTFSVDFQQYIEDLTVGAIIILLQSLMPEYGEIVDLLATAIDNLADDDITPNTAASYKEYYYYYATEGYYVYNSYGTHVGVTKVRMEWFTEEFYNGTQNSLIYYECASLS